MAEETTAVVEAPAPVEVAPVVASPAPQLPSSPAPAPQLKPGQLAKKPAPGPMVMHYLVRVPKAPAPHMVSGTPNSAPLRKFSEVTGTAIGHPNQGFAPACNPRQVTNERHRGSGEFWALLMLVEGEPVIGPHACEACVNSAVWQAALAKFREENDGKSHPAEPSDGVGVMAAQGCC